MLKHARRATIALTTSALLTTGLAATPTASAASDVTPQASAAAGWLVRGLDDGLLYNSYGANAFSSIDTLLGLQDLGIRPGARQAILGAFESDPGGYVGQPGATKAGALAKVLTAVQQEGIAPADYAEGDLLTRLESRVATTGSETGRAKNEGATDTSNTVGQSFAARALSMADSDLADEAVSFLLMQQCAGGYFRTYMESADHTCDSGTAEESAPDLDSTAFAILALDHVRDNPVAGVDPAGVKSALRSAAGWLVNQQSDNGSFVSSGEWGSRNSNSTGLAAQALEATGREARAAKAARWVASLRVTGKLIRATELRKADRGAIAFTRADLRTAKDKGITKGSLGTWQYATSQAFVSQDLLG